MGNELADDEAKRATVHYSIEEQDKVSCNLSNLKCYLHKQLMKQWNENISNRYQKSNPVFVAVDPTRQTFKS